MPVLWAVHDLDMPWTGAPVALTTTGALEVFSPIGGWNAGYRGSVYGEVENTGGAPKTIRAALLTGAFVWINWAYITMAPATTEPFGLSAADSGVDVAYLAFVDDCVGCVVQTIQLAPLLAPFFWTNHHGQTEIL